MKRCASDGFHPVPAFIYMAWMILLSAFSRDPVITALSLFGAALFSSRLQSARESLSDLGFYSALFIIFAAANPLFSHNGVTPLFFLNDNPVTLEAVLYGVQSACAAVAVLLWCKCLSRIFTTDKLLYLTGGLAPKAALVLSSALRMLPLIKRRHREIVCAQRAMGYYSEKGLIPRLQSHTRVYSALISRALEEAVETGSAMKARGYGLKGRTRFSLFRFCSRDAVLCAFLVPASVVTALMCAGSLDFFFYPRISTITAQPGRLCGYAAFALFSLSPFIFEITEELKWKYSIYRL